MRIAPESDAGLEQWHVNLSSLIIVLLGIEAHHDRGVRFELSAQGRAGGSAEVDCIKTRKMCPFSSAPPPSWPHRHQYDYPTTIPYCRV